jgi:hypothetical protein
MEEMAKYIDVDNLPTDGDGNVRMESSAVENKL